jgi:hypothetical protein
VQKSGVCVLAVYEKEQKASELELSKAERERVGSHRASQATVRAFHHVRRTTDMPMWL